MKKYFEGKALQDAKQHAIDEFPKESCGFIIGDKFIPCNNIASNPEEDFKIHKIRYMRYVDEIDAIIHSHNNYPHASKHDMEQQIATDLPWGIINLFNGKVEDVFFWGDQLPIQDLLGRPFYHGVYDCYNLVRDYYRIHNILLPQYPREWLFWHKSIPMIEENFKDAGFYEINADELQPGDAVVGKVAQDKVINHTAIYLGNNLILHHLAGHYPNYKSGLSRRDLLNRWEKYIVKYMRYKDAEKHTFIWNS
jgi:proteasome lid subunit RPN8/RPN11